MAEEKYVLTLTRDQALVAQNALELYARLKIGQFNRISELMLDVRSVDEYCKRRDLANDLLQIVAGIIYGKNTYGYPDVQKDALHHRAWNIYATLRYHMAWHDNPEGGIGCCYDEPYPWGGEPVPGCKVVEGEEPKGDAIHTIELPDGRVLMQKRYPRVLVVDQAYPDDGLRRVGDNVHDRLVIRKSEEGSYIAFVDMQSMAGTERMEDGYAFAGEYNKDELELVVPFDTVWIEALRSAVSKSDGKE